jgi:phospholipase/carboxylesterase
MRLQAVRWGPASGRARQLVVMCHGADASGESMKSSASHLGRLLPYAAFTAPDAPELYHGGPGRQWWPLGDRNPIHKGPLAERVRAILDPFIDAELERLALPPDAYALMGFSQGAMLVLYAGLRRAVAPRAILAYAGALVAPDRLEERRNDAPVLLVHGLSDFVVGAFRADDATAALKAVGVPVQTIFRPRLGHAVDAEGLDAGAAMLRSGFQL